MGKSKFLLATYAIVVVALDRLSKMWAVRELSTSGTQSPTDWLQLRLAHNTGVAFSLPLHGIPQIVITVVVILGIAYYFYRDYQRLSDLERYAIVSIMAGALSNGYDRLTQGSVVDFISLKYFAIFNVADIVISVGAGLLVLSYLLSDKTWPIDQKKTSSDRQK